MSDDITKALMQAKLWLSRNQAPPTEMDELRDIKEVLTDILQRLDRIERRVNQL